MHPALKSALAVSATVLSACGTTGGLTSKSLQAEYQFGVGTQDGDTQVSRLSIKARGKLPLAKNVNADVAVRFEHADDATGLGTLDSYSDMSKPIIGDTHTRLEIDKATLNFRSGGSRLSVGKQTFAWGVMDGIAITDRLDPVRRRDHIYGDIRPERIGRWSLRWRHKWGDLSLETAFIPDPTVSQLSEPGDAFEPIAPRFRAGFELGAALPQVAFSSRNDNRDVTYGARLSHPLGKGTFSVLGFEGPETDPVFVWRDNQIVLDYPKRRLFGTSYDFAISQFVLRFEGAFIPDQPVNTLPNSPVPLRVEDRERWLGGIGLDWNAPWDMFVNAQLGLDSLANQDDLFRPSTEAIYTLRAQRRFSNDRWIVKAENVGSLNDGDGAFNLEGGYDISDTVRLSAGANLAYGNQDEVFGQFKDQNRLWGRIRLNY